MGVYRPAALLVVICSSLGATIACSGDEPETVPLLEHSCDWPDAPAEKLFVREQRSGTEIRWAGGDWHEVSDEQYDEAVWTLCYS